jgi:hypothetical protein
MTEDNKENNRTPRSAETRAIKDTARKPWRPPSMLETPPAPEGFTYRWIRAEVVGQEDKKNVMSRLREGFDLVRVEEIGDFELPSIDNGKHAGVVSVVVCFWRRFRMKHVMKETPISITVHNRNKTRLTMI